MEPECIILDEPTAMLDPRGRREVLDAIHYLNQTKNITIILITHHMEEAEYADYLYVMKKGKVMAQGIPQDIWSQTDMLKDCGIGLPFDRMLIEALKKEHIEIPAGIRNQDELVEYLVMQNSTLLQMLGVYA